LEDFDVEITDDGFVIYLIPDDLKLKLLRKLDDEFDKFKLVFMANEYGIIKLKFLIDGD
jgi:hypothetical protein